jgi:hypothetical protein
MSGNNAGPTLVFHVDARCGGIRTEEVNSWSYELLFHDYS